jgi:L-gulonolactone oxidase
MRRARDLSAPPTPTQGSVTRNHYWTNWNRNLSSVNTLYRPDGLDELCENVRAAGRRAGPIRPIGNSCSWSPLCPTPGSMIDLSRLTRVIDLDETGDPPTVTVECGVSMRELVQFTRNHRLSIISPTIFQGVAMGGAIAVGAHGTGLGASTISDEVVAMTVVDAHGNPHHLEEHDGEVLDAARVSLGALGVVYSAKLRLHRAYNVHVEDRFISRREVLSGLRDMLGAYDFVELYWFPFSDTMWCKLMNRTDEPAGDVTLQDYERDAIDYIATMLSGQLILPFTARFLPSLTPLFLKIAPFFSVTPGVKVLPSSVEFHYQRAYPKNWDMSWGVPLDHAADAWRATMDLVESYARRTPPRYPVNMVVHSRFIGASNALLSPAYGRPICDIEAVTCTGTPDIEPFYQDFTDAMLAFPTARPHWGKYILRPRTIRPRYPMMDAFLSHRERFDPDGRFLNEFLEREVFQLTPHR